MISSIVYIMPNFNVIYSVSDVIVLIYVLKKESFQAMINTKQVSFSRNSTYLSYG